MGKGSFVPLIRFQNQNQLAREGSQSVSIVDRQFKENRALCLVQTLSYYLDQTKDLRGSRSLLFISFKKGYTSDIRPATLFLVKTNYPTLLQTRRSTVLVLGPSYSS